MNEVIRVFALVLMIVQTIEIVFPDVFPLKWRKNRKRRK